MRLLNLVLRSIRYMATARESKIEALLRKNFPKARLVSVSDVSGGCGAMFEIVVETEEFVSLPVLEQHRAIKKALRDEIQNMHGLTIKTRA
nr:putative bolA-like 3 [Schistosoma japonicum]